MRNDATALRMNHNSISWRSVDNTFCSPALVKHNIKRMVRLLGKGRLSSFGGFGLVKPHVQFSAEAVGSLLCIPVRS